MKQELKKWLIETLSLEGDFALEHPGDMSHGDFAANIALVESKKRGKNPRELAAEFVEIIQKSIRESISDTNSPAAYIEKVEVAGPGFINFFIKKEFFAQEVEKIMTTPEYGMNTTRAGQKTIIEYTNCNVLKPMHIGHLMDNIIGESLSRVLEASGTEIKRDTYQGDSGLHIAKVVWGITQLGGIKEGTLTEKLNYVGEAYAYGSTAYEDDPKAQEEIKVVNEKVFNKNDSELVDIYDWGRAISLAQFEEIYKKLGTKFDYYFFESEVADDALVLVREFLKKGLFEESEGAVVFKGETYDSKLHTRVFINNQGIPMYEAKDLAHALRKYALYPADTSIILTANEQDTYFQVVLRALQEINPDVAGRTKHLSHGILKLPTGKMSSRKGGVITAESLIQDIQNRVLEKIADREFSDAEKDTVAETVAIAALKYSILRQSVGGDIIFDFEKSLSFEGDSGPYVQYAYIRAHSVLEKVDKANRGASGSGIDSATLSQWQTTEVEKLLARFPEIVERAGREYAPHYIVTYVTELAGSFNAFYAQGKIIDESDPQSPYKIAITRAVAQVLKTGLNLLGIKVPEKM